jgi:hypothetical protein
MEPVPLMRVLARLHERCGEEVEEHVASTAEGREALWEAMLTVAICGDVLVDLVGDDVEDAILAYRRECDAGGAEGNREVGSRSLGRPRGLGESGS